MDQEDASSGMAEAVIAQPVLRPSEGCKRPRFFKANHEAGPVVPSADSKADGLGMGSHVVGSSSTAPSSPVQAVPGLGLQNPASAFRNYEAVKKSIFVQPCSGVEDQRRKAMLCLGLKTGEEDMEVDGSVQSYNTAATQATHAPTQAAARCNSEDEGDECALGLGLTRRVSAGEMSATTPGAQEVSPKQDGATSGSRWCVDSSTLLNVPSTTFPSSKTSVMQASRPGLLQLPVNVASHPDAHFPFSLGLSCASDERMGSHKESNHATTPPAASSFVPCSKPASPLSLATSALAATTLTLSSTPPQSESHSAVAASPEKRSPPSAQHQRQQMLSSSMDNSGGCPVRAIVHGISQAMTLSIGGLSSAAVNPTPAAASGTPSASGGGQIAAVTGAGVTSSQPTKPSISSLSERLNHTLQCAPSQARARKRSADDGPCRETSTAPKVWPLSMPLLRPADRKPVLPCMAPQQQQVQQQLHTPLSGPLGHPGPALTAAAEAAAAAAAAKSGTPLPVATGPTSSLAEKLRCVADEVSLLKTSLESKGRRPGAGVLPVKVRREEACSAPASAPAVGVAGAQNSVAAAGKLAGKKEGPSSLPVRRQPSCEVSQADSLPGSGSSGPVSGGGEHVGEQSSGATRRSRVLGLLQDSCRALDVKKQNETLSMAFKIGSLAGASAALANDRSAARLGQVHGARGLVKSVDMHSSLNPLTQPRILPKPVASSSRGFGQGSM